MPLVVPGLMSSGGSNNNSQDDWMNKLVGKKLTDSASDNTVGAPREAQKSSIMLMVLFSKELRKAGSAERT